MLVSILSPSDIFHLDFCWPSSFTVFCHQCQPLDQSSVLHGLVHRRIHSSHRHNSVHVFSVARSLLRRHSSRTASQDSTKSLKKYYQRERKVATTEALITGLFLVAWVPFFTVSVTAAYCPNCLPSSPYSLRGLVILVKSVHYLNSAVNPLVYARRNPEMKSTFLKLLGLKRFNSGKQTPWGFCTQAYILISVCLFALCM